MLVEAGFVEVESAADSLDLVTAPALRKALKDAGVSGLSGVKKADLMGLAREHLSPPNLRMWFPCDPTNSPPQGVHSLTPTPM